MAEVLLDYRYRWQTERHAVHLIVKGFIPGRGLTQDSRFFEPKGRRAGVIADWEGAGTMVLAPVREKRCAECGKCKLANKDHWHKNANSLFGLSSVCKTCRNGAEQARYLEKKAMVH